MSVAHYIVGDVRDTLATMPDNSVDLILTSPPFLALRSYLPADHPDKHKEIGSEPTPADFLDTLLDLTVEWRRVLTPHGSLVVELGDTYAGSGGAGGDYAEDGLREGQNTWIPQRARTVDLDSPVDSALAAAMPALNALLPSGKPRTTEESRRGIDAKNRGNTSRGTGRGRGWPLDKSLCGIPELYRLSLAYGRNILRPERTIEPWRIRNVIRWCRPNPPVGALGDKFRPGTSDMVVACTSRDRWFDLDAVREPVKPSSDMTFSTQWRNDPEYTGKSSGKVTAESAGAPPLDWWQVSTEPYAGSHYATWPRALLTRPIQAMCPRSVCVTCSEPRRRIVEDSNAYAAVKRPRSPDDRADVLRNGKGGDWQAPAALRSQNRGGLTRQTETLGWSDCGHNTWRNGLVLDPFGGSGVTGLVSLGHGRDCVMIDIDRRNLELARDRVGPMFFNEGPPPAWADLGAAS